MLNYLKKMKFSLWYNGKSDFLDLIEKHQDKIHSIYFPLPVKIVPSWRWVTQWNSYSHEILDLIAICNRYNIVSIALLNATCEWEKTGEKNQLIQILNCIQDLSLHGLKAISLSNMLYVPFIKKKFPNILLYSSVNCYVKTVLHAKYLWKLWIDVITIDRDINRNLSLIADIRRITGKDIQILLNEWCIQDCPFRQTHFNILSHCSNEHELQFSNLIDGNSCTPYLRENRRYFFQIPFVRPEDLSEYRGIVDIFKLTTRSLGTRDIENQLEAYSRGKYDGNLLDLLDMGIFDSDKYVPYINNAKLSRLNFFENMQHCPHNCDQCTNCDQYFDEPPLI